MSFQAQPTVEGVYRIKVFGTTTNAYWKYIGVGDTWAHMSVNSPWIKMTAVDESSDLFKWKIAPVPGQIDTFTIKPVSDQRVGIVSTDNNSQKYWGYGYPIGIIGGSARWKIEKRDNSCSRIRCEDRPNAERSYVLDSCEPTHDPIHFYWDKNAANQRWAFQLVPSNPPPPPPPQNEDDFLPE